MRGSSRVAILAVVLNACGPGRIERLGFGVGQAAESLMFWAEAKQMVGSDALGGDHFGVSVASDGDTVIVGADDKMPPSVGDNCASDNLS